MEDVITIVANLSTQGFEKGTKAVKKAISSLSRTANQFGRSMQRSMNSVTSSIRRLVPMLIGVSSVYGVLSKAVSAFMSQNEQLSSRMEAIWTALGNLLGPIITQIIDWVSTAVSYFITLLNLLGVTTKSASELSKKADNSAKQLQKTIAGFDELNVLQDNSKKENPLEDKEPSEWMSKLSELLKNKMWDDAADIIIAKMNELIYTFRDKAEELGQKIGEYLRGAIHIAARVLDETDWHELGTALAKLFNGLIPEDDAFGFGEDLGKLLVAKFTIAFKILTGFLEDPGWPKRIADILSGMMVGAFNSLANAIAQADFRAIGTNIRTFFEKLKNHTEEIKSAIYNFLKEAWNGALDLFWGLLAGNSPEKPPVIAALEKLGEAAKNLADALDPKIKEFWENVLKPLLEFVVDYAVPDFIEQLADMLSKLADVISGDMSFGEFVSNMSELQGILATIAAIEVGAGLATLVEKLGALFAIFVGGAGAAGAGGLAGAAGETATAIGGVSAASGAGVAALALITGEALAYADRLVHLGSAQKDANEAIASAGGDAEKLAEAYNKAASETERYTGWVNACDVESGSLHQAELDLLEAQREQERILQALAEVLGITTGELEEQIAAVGGDATQLDILKEATSRITEEQAILIDQLIAEGKSIDEIAQALGLTTDEVIKQADKQIELANAASDTAGASQDLANANQELGEKSGDAAEGVDGLKNEVTDTATIFDQKTDEMAQSAEDNFSLVEERSRAFVENVQSIFGEELGLMIDGLAERITIFNEEFFLSLDEFEVQLNERFTLMQEFVFAFIEALILGLAERITIFHDEFFVYLDEFETTFTERLTAFQENLSIVVDAMLAELNEKIAQFNEGFFAIFEEFSTEMETRLKAIQESVSKVSEEVEKAFTESWQKNIETIKQALNTISTNIKNSTTTIKTTVTTWLGDLERSVKTTEDNIKQSVDTTLTNIQTSVTNALNHIKTNVSNASSNISNNIRTTLNGIANDTKNSMNNIETDVRNTCDNIKTNIENSDTDINNEVQRFWDDLSNYLRNEWDSFVDEFNSDLDSLADDVDQWFEEFEENPVQKHLEALKQIFDESFDKFKESFKNMLEDVNQTADEQGGRINDTLNNKFSGLGSRAQSWGADVSRGFANGISSNLGAIQSAASSAASIVSSYLHFSEPDVGPLSNFHTFAPDMMNLFAEGIMDGRRGVGDAVESIAGEVADGLAGISIDKIGGLNNFADMVDFSVPTVAGGGFLPYGVDSLSGYDASERSREMFLEESEKLYEKMNDILDALSNVELVAQFGNVRAVVKEIRRIERQMNRAEGV